MLTQRNWKTCRPQEEERLYKEDLAAESDDSDDSSGDGDEGDDDDEDSVRVYLCSWNSFEVVNPSICLLLTHMATRPSQFCSFLAYGGKDPYTRERVGPLMKVFEIIGNKQVDQVL